MNDIHAVLFDLDGTLLDTAPDLTFAINRLREEQHLPALTLPDVRPLVSLGSIVMIRLLLGIDEKDPKFAPLRARFLDLYENHLVDSTNFFPDIEKVLLHIEEKKIPWGIVTNKLTRHAAKILKALELHERPGCIVCGDTLKTFKPDPAPILHGCSTLKVAPKNCLYVGDSINDVLASKGAGTKSLVALYGYIGLNDNPLSWQADGYIKEPLEILQWL